MPVTASMPKGTRDDRNVIHAFPQEAGMVQRRGQWKYAARGERPECRLEADHAAKRGRNSHRTTRVRAQARSHCPARNGGRRAAAGATWDTDWIQRIQGVAKGGAGGGNAPGKLVRCSLADDDRSAVRRVQQRRPRRLSARCRDRRPDPYRVSMPLVSIRSLTPIARPSRGRCLPRA